MIAAFARESIIEIASNPFVNNLVFVFTHCERVLTTKYPSCHRHVFSTIECLFTELGEHLHATNTLYYFVVHDKEIADFQEKVRPIEELHPTQVSISLIWNLGFNSFTTVPSVLSIFGAWL